MTDKPKVCCITATKNRHSCIERSIRYFLEQTYDNCVQLIYNNSCAEQCLSPNLDRIILVNNCKSLETGQPYTNLGQIYRDAIKFIPADVEVINFFDDDDTFLPNHISEGVKGLLKCGKTAYKPMFSYYRTAEGVFKIKNVMEPSIFVKKEHILKYGFSDSSTPQHLHWLHPLIDMDDICEDAEGVSTLIYDWSGQLGVFKTSGDPLNPNNFKNYHNYSQDIGDQVITPVSRKDVENYYRTK